MTTPNLTHRFTYHPPLTDSAKTRHEAVRHQLGSVASILDALLPDSREKSCAFSALEEAMFWANAAIARNQAPPAPAVTAPPASGQLTSYLLTEPKSCSRTHDCAGPEACNGRPRLQPPAPPRPQAGQ